MRLIARLILIALFSLTALDYAAPPLVIAQTDPCAGTVTNATVDDTQKYGVGLCVPLVDDKGLPVSPTSAKVAIDGGAPLTLAITRIGTTTTTINGVPHGYFESSKTALGPTAAGNNHSASVTYLVGSLESPAVVIPFAVSATPGNLVAPAKGRIVR